MPDAPVNGNPALLERLPARGPAFTTVALFGATTIVAQVLLLRECLVVVAGNELFIALFFGCWFVGIALGAVVGSILRLRAARLTTLVPCFLALQVVLLPFVIVLLRGVRVRWDLPVSQFVPFFPLLGIAAVHLCPFSFLTGLTFPMLCRLVAAVRRKEGRAIGSVYTVESLGSLIGGATATFVFAAYCRPLTGAWVLGVFTLANLAWFLLRLERRPSRVGAVAAACGALVFLVIVATPLRPRIEQWAAAFRHRAYGPGFEWLAERYTPYQHLALVRREGQYSLLSNGRFVDSFPDPYAIGQRVHVMMSQCPSARRLLVIGGGEGGALRKLLLYPDVRIDYVEIDPEVLALVRPYLEPPARAALDDARVRIIHMDARRFVRGCLAERDADAGALYDAVLCSTPDPSTAALNRFYTRDFFRQARQLVGPSGVFVTSISSGVNYFDRELLDYVGSVYRALVEAFGHVLATPGTHAYLFATARDDLLTSDVERLIARYERRGFDDPDFSPLYFHTAYETGQLNLVNRSFRGTLGSVPSNTDAEPVTYLYHLRLWNRFAGGRSQRFFDVVERYDWRWAVAAIGLLLVLRLVTWRRRPWTSDRAAYRHAAVVLFLTGVAGMVASIVILLLYQNFHGSLYSAVGLLVALFMAGLTLGGLSGNRLGREDKKALLVRTGQFALLYAVFFFALGSLVGARWPGAMGEALFDLSGFFYVAMVAAGWLTGVQFSLLGRLAVVCGRDTAQAGGTLECLDHLGACLGAFLTGIVLIPVSGVGATLLVLMGVELLAGASVLLSVYRLGQRAKAGSDAGG